MQYTIEARASLQGSRYPNVLKGGWRACMNKDPKQGFAAVSSNQTEATWPPNVEEQLTNHNLDCASSRCYY